MSLSHLNSVEGEAISRLLGAGVSFVVVGGHAVLHYTLPQRPEGGFRTLGDLDLFVSRDVANLSRLASALTGPGWQVSAETLGAALGRGQSVSLAPYRVQFIPTLDGVDWESVSRMAEMVYSAAGPAPVISRELLIQNKKAVGRPKDLEDVRALEGVVNDAA